MATERRDPDDPGPEPAIPDRTRKKGCAPTPHSPTHLPVTGVGSTADSLFLDWRRNGDLRALAQVYDLTAADLLRVAMQLADLQLFSSSMLRGRIVFENREPVPGIRLRVGNHRTETDELGRFAASSLPRGDHKLVLRDERNRRQHRIVTTDAPE